MIELIPAIDIIDGRCVRLQKGIYESKKVYDVSPVDVAKEVEQLGYRRLHIVDLDGAKSAHVVNIDILKEIASKTSLSIDFGGGIKTNEDLEAVFQSGAAFATIGSVAVKQKKLFCAWLERWGAGKFVLGADVNNGKISINGWREDSEVSLLPFIREYYYKGVRNVLCTDISRDGMLQGSSVDLYKNIMQTFPDLHLIASGGIGSEQDIMELEKAHIPAVVFGKAIYEGRIDLAHLAQTYHLERAKNGSCCKQCGYDNKQCGSDNRQCGSDSKQGRSTN